jgi:hypothetical protein
MSSSSPSPFPDTKVTLQVNGFFLPDLLTEIVSADGLRPRKLRISPKMEDWRISIFAASVPLDTVLESVAHLFDAEWKNTSDSDFVLSQSDDARRYTERSRRLTVSRTIELFDRLIYLCPGSRKAVRPRLFYTRAIPDVELHQSVAQATPEFKGYYDLLLYSTLSPAQKEALIRTERLRLRWERMTASQKQIALKQVEAGYPSLSGPTAEAQDVERNHLQRFGMIMTARGDHRTGLPFALNSVALRYNRGVFLSSSHSNPYKKRPNYRVAEEDKSPQAESILFPETFQLHRDMNCTWGDILQKLSDAAPNLILVSDEYTGFYNPFLLRHTTVPTFKQKTLAEGLDALCRLYNKQWWRKGDIFFFRSRTWFIEEQYEAPRRTVIALQRLLIPGKFDPVQVLMLLGKLSPQQLEGLSLASYFQRAKEVIQNNLMDSGRNQASTERAYPVLRLFTQLSAAQQTLALTEKGIPFAQLTPPQQTLLREVSESVTVQADEALVLHASCSGVVQRRAKDAPLLAAGMTRLSPKAVPGMWNVYLPNPITSSRNP